MASLEEWIIKEISPYTGAVKGKEQLANAMCNSVYFLDAEKGRFVVKIAAGEKRKSELKNESAVMGFLKTK